MAIEVTCPGCEKRYRVPENLAGKRIRCKECQKAIAVPAELNEDDELEEPEPEPRPKKSKKVRVAPEEEDDHDERPRKSKKGKRKKSKSGGIPVWVYLAGGGGLAAVIAVVVLIVVLSGNRKTPPDKNLPPIAGNPGGNNPVKRPVNPPPGGNDEEIEQANAIFNETLGAFEAVTAAVSQVQDRATLETAINTIQSEKTKLVALKNRVEAMPKVAKLDRERDREMTKQMQAKSEQFRAEMFKVSSRLRGKDADLPTLQRFEQATRDFGQEMINLGRAVQAKTK